MVYSVSPSTLNEKESRLLKAIDDHVNHFSIARNKVVQELKGLISDPRYLNIYFEADRNFKLHKNEWKFLEEIRDRFKGDLDRETSLLSYKIYLLSFDNFLRMSLSCLLDRPLETRDLEDREKEFLNQNNAGIARHTEALREVKLYKMKKYPEKNSEETPLIMRVKKHIEGKGQDFHGTQIGELRIENFIDSNQTPWRVYRKLREVNGQDVLAETYYFANMELSYRKKNVDLMKKFSAFIAYNRASFSKIKGLSLEYAIDDNQQKKLKLLTNAIWNASDKSSQLEVTA